MQPLETALLQLRFGARTTHWYAFFKGNAGAACSVDVHVNVYLVAQAYRVLAEASVALSECAVPACAARPVDVDRLPVLVVAHDLDPRWSTSFANPCAVEFLLLALVALVVGAELSWLENFFAVCLCFSKVIALNHRYRVEVSSFVDLMGWSS